MAFNKWFYLKHLVISFVALMGVLKKLKNKLSDKPNTNYISLYKNIMTSLGLISQGFTAGAISSIINHVSPNSIFAIGMQNFSIVVVGTCSLILAGSLGIYACIAHLPDKHENPICWALAIINGLSLTAGVGLLGGRIATSVFIALGKVVLQSGV